MRTSSASPRRIIALTFLAALSIAPASALAQSARLEVLVAAVSNDGNKVDPALVPLSQSFKRNGLSYTSFQLQHSSRLELKPGESANVPLNGGKATITLVKNGANGAVTLKLVAPNNSPTFDMTPGGEFVQQVGTLPKGKLFLVIRR